MTPKPDQFIVDNKGRTKAVLLSLAEYRKIVDHLYDLEDALDLKHAIATSKKMISYAAFRGQLKNQGIL